jgi:hypothetical protein
VIEAIIAGVVSGILSPLFLAWLRHEYIWKSEKRLEQKYKIFIDAVKALALFSTDALDPRLQSEKASYKNVSRATECRPETFEAVEISLGMVKAFFKEPAFSALDKAFKQKLSIENVPNTEFENARVDAIIAMASELGIAPTMNSSGSAEVRR